MRRPHVFQRSARRHTRRQHPVIDPIASAAAIARQVELLVELADAAGHDKLGDLLDDARAAAERIVDGVSISPANLARKSGSSR